MWLIASGDYERPMGDDAELRALAAEVDDDARALRALCREPGDSILERSSNASPASARRHDRAQTSAEVAELFGPP